MITSQNLDKERKKLTDTFDRKKRSHFKINCASHYNKKSNFLQIKIKMQLFQPYNVSN